MDLHPRLDLRCPSCSQRIEQRVQRRLNRFWSGLQIIECESCGSKIQWHHSLHRKLRVGGFILRAGLIIALFSIVALVLDWKPYDSVLLASGILTIAGGVLATHTPKDQVKVELVDNT
jgi:DNA-directed RNA polymerase subunit RPC12/RpoP